MKALITIAIFLGLYFLGKSIFGEYKNKEAKEQKAEAVAKGEITSDGLSGMPPQFEPSYLQAKSQGAAALKAWLERYHSYIQDPKLASIQLDYVVLVGRSNPAEAKRIFAAVKARTPKTSPIYNRVHQLNATFGN